MHVWVLGAALRYEVTNLCYCSGFGHRKNHWFIHLFHGYLICWLSSAIVSRIAFASIFQHSNSRQSYDFVELTEKSHMTSARYSFARKLERGTYTGKCFNATQHTFRLAVIRSTKHLFLFVHFGSNAYTHFLTNYMLKIRFFIVPVCHWAAFAAYARFHAVPHSPFFFFFRLFCFEKFMNESERSSAMLIRLLKRFIEYNSFEFGRRMADCVCVCVWHSVRAVGIACIDGSTWLYELRKFTLNKLWKFKCCRIYVHIVYSYLFLHFRIIFLFVCLSGICRKREWNKCLVQCMHIYIYTYRPIVSEEEPLSIPFIFSEAIIYRFPLGNHIRVRRTNTIAIASSHIFLRIFFAISIRSVFALDQSGNWNVEHCE